MHRQQVKQLGHQTRSTTIYQKWKGEQQSQFAKENDMLYLEAILYSNEMNKTKLKTWESNRLVSIVLSWVWNNIGQIYVQIEEG